MNYKFHHLKLALMVVVAGAIFVESAPAGKVFTMDAASFRQRGGLIYQEVYFLIQRDRLKFTQTVDGFEAQYQIKVDLYESDSLLSVTSWEMVDKALKLEDITPRQKLPDIVVFNLSSGFYTFKGSVTDLNQDITYTDELQIDLASYPDSGLVLSDIELAMKLQKGEEGSKFYKNGFLVIPNPERIYGPSLPMLYYYAEIYNLVPGEGAYSIERLILDDVKNPVNQLPKKSRKKLAASLCEIDGFSVASLSSGTYYLNLTARDLDTQESATEEVKFFVYRAEDFAEPPETVEGKGPSALELEFLNYSEEELNEAILELKYLLSDTDWRTVEGLNMEGQRQYLVKFWTGSDPDPATAVNEFRVLFEERKRQANEKYGIWDTPGWKTPRGRVLILHGQPDDIEYHPHDPATRSYEVWFYDGIEGGVNFVFVDRNNFGDYRLVHSTKKGELFRPNWFEEEALIRKP